MKTYIAILKRHFYFICKGCGKCATICRLKAIDPLHYDFKQITSIVEPYFLEKAKRKESKDFIYAE